MPSPPITLRGVDAKIVRADKHLETLEAEILTYLDKGVARFPSKLYRDKRIVRIHFKLLIEPPLELSITVGDIVHNARSALDHLWAALTRSTKGSFPIYRDATKWDGERMDVLCRVPIGAHALIDSLQPCSGTNDGGLLGLLNSLSNSDKHKLINLTAARSVRNRFALSSVRTKQTVHFPFPHALDPDTHIDVTDLTDEIMDGGVDVKLSGRLTVAFKDGSVAGRNTRDLLRDIVDALKDRTVPQLRPFINRG